MQDCTVALVAGKEFIPLNRFMTDSASNWVQFIGHFHPLLVHLPIGFIILLAILEALALLRRFKQLTSSSRIILLVTVPVAAVTVLCGWLLSQSEDYDAHLLAWHKWTGIGVGVATILLLILHWRGWQRAYRACLFTTLFLLIVAGHFGGELTHGTDYLTRYAPAALRPLLGGKNAVTPRAKVDLQTQTVSAAVIQPIFSEYCVRCHGPGKSKGGLKLNTIENLFKGGDSGPTIVAGNSAQSLFIKRLLLPLDDDDHMPPEGKRQPSYDDLLLLQWWVDAGAPTNKTAFALGPPENVLRALELTGPSAQ